MSDILRAIEKIQEFNSGIEDYKRYEDDIKTQSATERQLGIIGDALKKHKTLSSRTITPDDQLIISFRNRLIHAYNNIDNSIVWVMLQKHIPILKQEIQKLLNPNSLDS